MTMMFTAAVGHSQDPDSQEAISEVLTQCRQTLGTATPKAGIVFMNIDYDHALVLQQIQASFPGITIVGGTTDGEMSSVLGFDRNSLCLMLLAGEGLECHAGVGYQAAQEPDLAAKQAIAQAQSTLKHPAKFCIALPEGLKTDGSHIVRALRQELGEAIPIFGAATGDSLRLRQTHQFYQDQVLTDAVVVLVVAGSIKFAFGIAHGRVPIGHQGVVTQVKGNTICQIDHAPALTFFQKYIGDLNPTMQSIGVFESDQNQFYVRSLGGYDLDSGHLVMFASVPEGARVQMTMHTHDEILLAAKTALHQALQAYPGKKPTAALLFSCANRRQMLGSHTAKEYGLIQSDLGMALDCCGFYGYGEIAPLAAGQPTQFHNESFAVLLLGIE